MQVAPAPAAGPSAEALNRLEAGLGGLGQALAARDAAAVADAALALQGALDALAAPLRRPGAMTPAMRRHLTLAVGRLAAQREALARAAASVDRAIEVLMPSPLAGAAGLYGAAGFVPQRGDTGLLGARASA